MWSPTGASLGDTSSTDATVIDDIVAPATGTYLVLVASFDPGLDGTGTYRLTMTKTQGPITVSPGDEGGPLINGAIHTGEIIQGDVDVWTFTANAGERIAVHIGEIADTDNFQPWIRMWSPTGASLGDTSSTDATVIDDIVAPATGTYLVLVASFDPGLDGTGTYRLTMTKTPGPITVSPGDEGGPLDNGAIHTGEIIQGDVDVWTFTANAGERIAVHIGEIVETDNFQPWIRIWSPTGSSLGDTSGTDAAALDDIVAPTTGTYLVLVASFDPGLDGTGTYRLTMTHTPGPIIVSPGDEGGPLTGGAAHAGVITLGDLDVWTVTANIGDPLSLRLVETSETDDFRPWIRLWSPTGASLGDTSGLTEANINVASAPVTGTYLVLVASFDSGFDGTGSYGLTLTSANGRPVANAGTDQNVNTGSTVQLNGAGSTDPDNNPLTYLWTLSSRPPGSNASLSSASAIAPTFVADVSGTYTVQLVVNDGVQSSLPDLVDIRANSPPVANAGPDQDNVAVGAAVTLNGSQSIDPDGNPVVYSWEFFSKPALSAAVLVGANTPSPTFAADRAGLYRIRLTVSDSIATAVDDVDVTTVVPPPGEQASANTAALSFFNPAHIPGPTGTDVARASVAYYNPAQIPSPDGVLVAGRASVSYYNPATIPSPDSSIATNSASVTYYNPAVPATPTGAAVLAVASISYNNPPAAAPVEAPDQHVAAAAAAERGNRAGIVP
jgi:hypothetical protein